MMLWCFCCRSASYRIIPPKKRCSRLIKCYYDPSSTQDCPLFHWKKSRTLPGPFRAPVRNFPGPFRSPLTTNTLTWVNSKQLCRCPDVLCMEDIFPGLSRTKVLFQDFQGPGIFKKKIQDFPGGVGTLVLVLSAPLSRWVIPFLLLIPLPYRFPVFSFSYLSFAFRPLPLPLNRVPGKF